MAIKWRRINGVPFWHWVVCMREAGECVVLDSKTALKNNVRRDFGRMKPEWFIEVTGSVTQTLADIGVWRDAGDGW